ncbi:MAG: MFS transporter [Chloroflexi bacterium]|nr:MFS transporter [Chloroflexota bacterium]
MPATIEEVPVPDIVSFQARVQTLGWMTNLGFITYGLVNGLIGTALPGIMQSFGLVTAQAGLLASIPSLGAVSSALLGGILYDRLDRRVLLIGTFTTLGITLILLGASPIFVIAILAAAGQGFIGGMLNSVLNAVLVTVYELKAGKFLARAHALYSLGALISPLYVGFIVGQGGSWRWSYFITAIPLLILAWFTTSRGAFPAGLPQQRLRWGEFHRLGRRSLLWILTLAMACGNGAMGAIAAWAVTYLHTDRNLFIQTAGVGLSLFFAGGFSGRLLTSKLVTIFSPPHLLVLDGLGSAAAVGVLLLAPHIGIAMAALYGVGLFGGGIYPLIMTYANHSFPPEVLGTTVGMIATGAGFGNLVLVWGIGVIAGVAGMGPALGWAGAAFFLTSLFIPLGAYLDKRR